VYEIDSELLSHSPINFQQWAIGIYILTYWLEKYNLFEIASRIGYYTKISMVHGSSYSENLSKFLVESKILVAIVEIDEKI